MRYKLIMSIVLLCLLGASTPKECLSPHQFNMFRRFTRQMKKSLLKSPEARNNKNQIKDLILDYQYAVEHKLIIEKQLAIQIAVAMMLSVDQIERSGR